jgi:PAS domain S-box-containing protein
LADQLTVDLRESEEKYRSVFIAESDAIFLIDKETGAIIEVNNAVCDIYGYTQEELIRLKNHDLSAEPEKAMQETTELNKTIPLRYHRKKDGTIFPVEISANSFVLKGRDIILAAIRDITERMLTEKMLQQNEERLRLSLSGADLGMWDWNVVSGAVTFNERWATMLGYTLNEIEPNVHTWEMLLHPEDNQHVTETLNAHLEGKTDTYTAEHRLRHKSGKWIWILDSGRVIERDVQGKALRLCGTHLDITGRKVSDEELARYRNHLAELVELRTFELQEENTKRRVAEESLQKANDTLEKKASALGDMNTALNVLLNKREQDVQEIEEKIFCNYESRIMPFFNKLKSGSSNKNQQNLIAVLEASLKEIISPFSKKLSDPMINFTHQEIQIASFIKQGFSNKEMAQTLICSVRTIEAHRDNIRKKMGLKNKKQNLKSFLMNL